MQHLNTLWQLASAASQVADLARSSQTYRFGVQNEVTFYLHAAGAEVVVTRWLQPLIEVVAQLQAPFGWRIETDQDDAGVYFVARRRPVVGGLAGAAFRVFVPQTTYLVLKLEDGHVTLRNISGAFHLPPAGADAQFEIRRQET